MDGRLHLQKRGGLLAPVWEAQAALVHGDHGPIPPSSSPARTGALRVISHTPGSLTAYLGVTLPARRRRSASRAGSTVTMPKRMFRLGPNRVLARSFDDRVGATALLLALARIDPAQLKRPVIFAWSVGEEVGLDGAKVLAERFKDLAEVHAVDTFVSSDSPIESKRFAEARLGAGAVLRAMDNGYLAPRELIDRFLGLASRHQIPSRWASPAAPRTAWPSSRTAPPCSPSPGRAATPTPLSRSPTCAISNPGRPDRGHGDGVSGAPRRCFSRSETTRFTPPQNPRRSRGCKMGWPFFRFIDVCDRENDQARPYPLGTIPGTSDSSPILSGSRSVSRLPAGRLGGTARPFDPRTGRQQLHQRRPARTPERHHLEGVLAGRSQGRSVPLRAPGASVHVLRLHGGSPSDLRRAPLGGDHPSREATPGDRLPAILPLVLYNGKRPWLAPLDLASLFEEAPSSLRRYLPRLRYLLLDERIGWI